MWFKWSIKSDQNWSMAALLDVLPLGAVFLIGGHGPFDLGYVVPPEQSRCFPEVRLLTTKLAKQSRAFRCQPAGYTLSRGRPAVLEVPLSLQFLPNIALRWVCCPRACPAPSSCRPSAPSDPKHSWKVPVLRWLWDVVTKFILLSRYRSVHLGCNATEHLLLVPSQYEWRFQTVMCCMMFSGS